MGAKIFANTSMYGMEGAGRISKLFIRNKNYQFSFDRGDGPEISKLKPVLKKAVDVVQKAFK